MIKKLLCCLFILFFLTSCSLDESFGYLEKEEIINTSSNTLTVHFLDVGQADASFIELPNHQTMLIDAAQKNDAEFIISYIKNLGYTKIDYVIATHPHVDHIGALSDVINNFDIGLIYMPKVVSTSKTYENTLTTIKDKGLSIKTGVAGVEVLNEDYLNIFMLAPNKSTYSGFNNYSIVLKITYYNNSFLFMGDAEELSEKEITGNVKSDVLKVGHHGADTSSSIDFLNLVQPKYAIISVGENNSYNHPSNIILERLKNYTSNIYRTDINGTIILKSDGTNIKVELERN